MQRGREMTRLSDDNIDFTTQSPSNILFDFDVDDLPPGDEKPIPPTHALHVRCISTGGLGRIYAIHPLVLIAHCATLPTFRPAPYVDPSIREDVPLPRVSLPLPHPESFPIILDHLYKKSKKDLWLSLCPVPPDQLDYIQEADDPNEGTRRVFEVLGRTYSDAGLVLALERVRGVWSNAYHLAVDDEDLWSTIQSVWYAFGGAMAARAGSHANDEPPSPASTLRRGSDHQGCVMG